MIQYQTSTVAGLAGSTHRVTGLIERRKGIKEARTSSLLLTGLSSNPGQGVIIAARDYDRQFSAHMVGGACESYFPK